MVKNDLMFSLNLELNWSKKIDIFLFSNQPNISLLHSRF